MWIEAQIEVAAEAAELIADAVGPLTGGVEVRDGGTLIRAGAGRAVIVALCLPERIDELLAELDAVCARARAAGLPIDPVEVRRREAHEDEWRDIWKQYFRATRVGRTFIVRPSWDPGSVVDGDRVIDLDPGRAFGTGGHASTRLAIELAEPLADGTPVAGAPVAGAPVQPSAPAAVRRFLDLGCGSGILAIAAARLWPRAAGLAVDNDPEATACAQENLDRNRITTVRVLTGTLADLPGRADDGGGHGGAAGDDDGNGGAPHFDLILANIQADVLLDLAAQLPRRLAPGGALILSGLLTSDGPVVAERYRGLGLRLEATRSEDEWTALRLIAPAPSDRAV